MPERNIICIAASAGGVESLCQLNKSLPTNLDASLFVVMHVGHESVLPEILTRCGGLPARSARNNQRFKRGQIYVAPPEHHLSIKDGKTILTRGPRENGYRPSADVLFRSAAREHRSRVIGVVLSGARDDGSAGLFLVKARGGIAIVQDPDEAVIPSMPKHAIEMVEIDYCLPLRQMANLLPELVTGKATNVTESSDDDVKIALNEPTQGSMAEPPGSQVPVSCPECNGPIYEVKEGKLVRFQCFTGHSYSPASLSDRHTEALERALWTAMRKLKERIVLHERLVSRKRQNKAEAELIERLRESMVAAQRDIKLLRDILNRI